MDKIKDRTVWTKQKLNISRRDGKKNTEELYKNDLNDLENHSGVFTHLEPNI